MDLPEKGKRTTPHGKGRNTMKQWKVWVNGRCIEDGISVYHIAVVKAVTKEEAKLIAIREFLSLKNGAYEMSKTRPIQYAREIKQ